MISRGEQCADPESPFGEKKQKRFYMHKEHIDKFGMTSGRNGCLALMVGAPSANHSEVCRARIEGELAKCGGQGQAKFEKGEAKRAKNEDARKLARPDKTGHASTALEGEPQRKKTAAPGEKDDRIPAPGGVDISVEDDDMILAQWHKRSRDTEQDGRGVRQRGGASSSSGPAPPPTRGVKRQDDAAEQLNPLRPDLDNSVVEDIGRVVIGCSKLGAFIDGVDVAELFNPEHFTGKAASFGLLPGTAFDLRCGWNLSVEADRDRCWRQLVEELPAFVVGGLLCAPFSNAINMRGNVDEHKKTEANRLRLAEAVEHLQFCYRVYRWQVDRGCYFLHEHPWSASSWKSTP